jgi:hypothetical protein
MKWAKHIADMGEIKKQSLGRETLRENTTWKDNIKMDVKGIGQGIVVLIHPAQDRPVAGLLYLVMNPSVPRKTMNFFTNSATISF